MLICNEGRSDGANSNLAIDRQGATPFTTMESPGSEIVVSKEPPPPSPPTSPPKMIEEPDLAEPGQPPIDQPPSTAGDGDALSKKSFKRK
jgi:hypothetical protein